MRIRLLALLCLCSVGLARATPKTSNLPFTDKQFEMAVACIKHFEGWHNMKDYVGYGHQYRKGNDILPKQGQRHRVTCCYGLT